MPQHTAVEWTGRRAKEAVVAAASPATSASNASSPVIGLATVRMLGGRMSGCKVAAQINSQISTVAGGAAAGRAKDEELEGVTHRHRLAVAEEDGPRAVVTAHQARLGESDPVAVFVIRRDTTGASVHAHQIRHDS